LHLLSLSCQQTTRKTLLPSSDDEETIKPPPLHKPIGSNQGASHASASAPAVRPDLKPQYTCATSCFGFRQANEDDHDEIIPDSEDGDKDPEYNGHEGSDCQGSGTDAKAILPDGDDSDEDPVNNRHKGPNS